MRAALLALAATASAQAALRAGAAKVDVTPKQFPVVINCGFLERASSTVNGRLYARAVVLDDGTAKLAIAVVDSCMMPRELIDRAKEAAHARTGIAPGRMLVSATHTHSAPSVMACLGSGVQDDYAGPLADGIASAIESAAARIEPARVGWASVHAPEWTHTRRWIYRPDRMLADPFGNRTVRANMHPGYQNPAVIAPSGPSDPELSVLAIRAASGRPIAVLANYSMHYFGAPAVHPDYYGLFAERFAAAIGASEDFVAMMSQGTSGDQQWMDYSRPKPATGIEDYAAAVTEKAVEVYRRIGQWTSPALRMAEAKLKLHRRVPDGPRLEWARALIAGMGGRKPANQPEVYAHEAVFLHNEPQRELKLQAIRIGALGVTAIPNEVYAITGLRLKAMSPLEVTFNIELANGAEGYIPPPDQHKLGGYTTWPARTAGLEVEAEPRIVETLLGLLEQVSGRRRREPRAIEDAYSRAVRLAKPLAYWRLEEFHSPVARDSAGRHDAAFEGGVAFYLPGASGRCVYLAGG